MNLVIQLLLISSELVQFTLMHKSHSKPIILQTIEKVVPPNLNALECGDCGYVNRKCKVKLTGYRCGEYESNDFSLVSIADGLGNETAHLRECLPPEFNFKDFRSRFHILLLLDTTAGLHLYSS
ncbi:uncharacterized protein LOC124461424 isoform X2 [Drosophila willistoni]|uniref:uncharacterized protein LOC111518647 isoform X2 n=1 Tax=Drosophila willistoni TaxID=7260 RepID=UPI001F07DD06|nr:uncharacterized protein LOC111518647 isoform X2 [Drosophila willistoni]XP_046868900.1 uncharacterized protein LOC124461424 isoform X2 [Drosophila willistoni]